MAPTSNLLPALKTTNSINLDNKCTMLRDIKEVRNGQISDWGKCYIPRKQKSDMQILKVTHIHI